MFGSIKQAYLNKRREECFKTQRWDELAAVCRDLLAIDENDFEAVHDLVVALKECKRLDEAYPWCERALKLAPRAAPEQIGALKGLRYLRHLIVSAEVFVHRGQLDRARALLLPLKKLGTSFHKKHLLLSEIAEKKGDLGGAAAELEEMRDYYASREVHQWEHVILARARALLSAARQAGDADAIYRVTLLIAKCRERIGELDGYIQARAGDAATAVEFNSLRAHRGLLRRAPAETQAAAAALEAQLPRLADLFAGAALAAQGKAREAFARLQRAPAGRVRLEALEALRRDLFNEAAYLRELSSACLAAGRLEEAFAACQAMTIHSRCELADLARMKELRQLLVARAIWEDEARLGLRPDVPAGPDGRPDLSAVASIRLDAPSGPIETEPSPAFRLAALHAMRSDDAQTRVRLAENYLRSPTKAAAAARLLEEAARPGSPVEAKALCLLALQRVRAKDPAAAQAVERFKTARVSADDRKRMLLDLGDAAEAAGLRDVSASCYAAVAEEDPSYGDVQERLEAVKKGPPPGVSSDDAAASLRERFQDLRPIGRGGMGLVFKAFDPLYSRWVALKVLSDHFRGDAAAVARFVREGQAMAQLLNHPGIAQVYEVGTGRDIYLAMELIEGPSLREVLRRSGRLPHERVAELGAQLCDALGFAHAAGIVHRDVKPDNVQLSGDKAKLLDFGLADIAQATALTRAGSVMGTGQYMAPEQVRGADMDGRTDIYALGVTLYELATGRPPFYQGDLAYQQLNEAPRPPREVVAQIPEAMEAAILRCLQKDPHRRFQTCAELALALKEAEKCRS